MPLYDITHVKMDADQSPIMRIQRTSFAAEGIQERSRLQAALRDHIDVLGLDVFVISEEFGAFEGVHRRIDLLCLDRGCRLVVVELKRTTDGGHMELQALRYAAMISTMTFAQVVSTLASYRLVRGREGATVDAAREDLLEFLDDDSDPTVPREVGIVLASEDFSQEITTTVLWLNEFHDFDIRCVRLSPYRLGDRLLLDAQQVVPLPEASAYTVRVREKEVAEKKAKAATGSDWTKFVVTLKDGQLSTPLPKRWAVLEAVKTLAALGVDMRQVAAAMRPSKSFRVQGIFADEDELWAEAQRVHDKPDPRRWHLADRIEVDGETWVIHTNWGRDTRETLAKLQELAPDDLQVYEEAEAPTGPATQ